MDQDQQRDHAEEAFNRALLHEDEVDEHIDEVEVDEPYKRIEKVSDREMAHLLNKAGAVHFVDGDDAVFTVATDRLIVVALPGNIVYAINIEYIRALLNRI